MPDDQGFKDFYAGEAEVYEERRYETRYGALFRALHYRILQEELNKTDPEAFCLEVACGTGHTTRLLANHFRRMAACDLTPEMMARNIQRNRGGNVTYLRSDAFALPFADASVDVLVSTRFLHLFPWQDQLRLIREFKRVLVPGGRLIVDFDNIVSRWIYAVPHVVYNLLRYRRLAPFSIYNLPGRTLAGLEREGFEGGRCLGVGGWHLILAAPLPEEWSCRIGLMHRRPPLSALAEQFLISATKRGRE